MSNFRWDNGHISTAISMIKLSHCTSPCLQGESNNTLAEHMYIFIILAKGSITICAKGCKDF